jgi:DNA repair protein REV1
LSQDHFDDEAGDEYEGSAFGGFGDYFRRKKIKLQNLDAEWRSQAADNPPIFRGVVVHINGYTQPSLNDLHKLIVTHHGGFLQYLDGKTMVTHIVASNLTPKKAMEFKKYRIVKPAWVVDSVKAGRLLPWDSYRVVDEGPKQKLLGFNGGRMVSHANETKRGYRDQTDTSWYTDNMDNISVIRTSSQRKEDSTSSSPLPTVENRVFDQSEENEDEMIKKRSSIPTSPPKADSPTVPKEPTSSIDYSNLSIDSRFDAFTNDSKTVKIEPDAPEISENTVQAEHVPEKRQADDVLESPAKRLKLTAEEHNAILLADPDLRKSTVVNPNFLEQYYRESRLHRLSAWKADLKSEFQAMADKTSTSQKLRQKRPPGSRRYILHVDFDCFFAAVSLKKQPQFKDKPAVVAHGNGSGSEIASCNYVARKFGVKNGMWMKRAQDLCPELKILPYDFPGYEEASRAFYERIIATGGIVQSVSVDEALVDITTLVLREGSSDGLNRAEDAVYREQEAASNIALELRSEIKKATDCDVSIGIGGNILLAKLALRKAKPAGQYQILSEEILDFIGKLEVQDLPGVAYNIGGKLEDLGIKLIKDVREVSKEKLINTLGPKTGEKIWEYARGIDRKEVGDVEIRKSVSAEVNWGVRFENQQQVDEFIENLCGELSRRLLKESVKGKQLTLKLMKRSADAPLDPPKHLGHGKCDTFNKSTLLGVATNVKELLTKETLSLLKTFRISPGELRGIGVQMTKLEPLKSGTESSQKVLQFKKPSVPRSERIEDPIQDVVTPKKPKDTGNQFQFGADQLNQLTPSRKPLNTMGTQFLLPTQVDPTLLDQLPADIRSRLLSSRTKTPNKDHTQASKASNKKMDGFPDIFTALPNKSQVDMETFKALPKEMREEVNAFYGNSPSAHIKSIEEPSRELDSRQSPQRDQLVDSPSKPKPSRPKGRGRPKKAVSVPQSNLLTSHFRKTTPDTGSGSGSDTRLAPRTKAKAKEAKPALQLKAKTSTATNQAVTSGPLDYLAEVDPVYLAALPEDLRAEALAAHRQQQIRAKNISLRRARKQAEREAAKNRPPPPVLLLPPRPPKPTFTAKGLSSLPDIKNQISAWVKAFEEEGPYDEDVTSLADYIGKVITEERDMEKAVACVKWFVWITGDGLGEYKNIQEWNRAVDVVKKAAQEGVKARGLGRIKL